MRENDERRGTMHNSIRIEEMSMNAWPALRTSVHKGCILRTANGYTKRANSANPLYTQTTEYDDVIAFAEKFYGEGRTSPTFKIIDTPDYVLLDCKLQHYEILDPTSVMTCDLPENGTQDGCTVEKTFSPSWMSAFVRMNSVGSNAETARSMLELIRSGLLVASIRKEDRIIACGYGAVENEYVGFFDIVVDEEFRGNGYGRKIMRAIMDEARAAGADRGYLQVVKANTVAMNLYSSLGFKQEYSYWYRRKIQ